MFFFFLWVDLLWVASHQHLSPSIFFFSSPFFFLFEKLSCFISKLADKKKSQLYTEDFLTHLTYACVATCQPSRMCTVSASPTPSPLHTSILTMMQQAPLISPPLALQETAWGPTCWRSTRCWRSPPPSAFTTGCPTRWATGRAAATRTRQSIARSTTACRQVRGEMTL